MDYRSSLFFSVTLGFLAPSAAVLLEYFKKRISEIISSLTPPNPKKTTFKLLKLPWVALEEVLKVMEHRDVFMLSLCSKNTLNVLKIFKLKANLYFIDRDCELSVYSLQSNDHRDLIFSSRCTYNTNHWAANQQNLIRLKIGEMDVQCLWKGDGLEYLYTANREAFQQALDNQIHQLFTVKTIDLELSEVKFWKKNYPNISKVTDLWISHECPIHMEYILEKYPNLKSFRMKGSVDVLPAHAKLLNVEYVFFENTDYYWASFLRENFRGRYLALSGASIRAIDVLKVVYGWISGRKYFNLEVFLMSDFDNSLNIEWILNELKTLAKEWNRPTVYEYWSRAIVAKRNRREEIDLSGNEYKAFMDFERETDQKMATLMLSDFKFAFIVWK